MPHTTRQNYKSKLLAQQPTASGNAIAHVAASDKLFDILEKEERDKRQLHKLIAEVAGVAIDVVKKLDQYSDIGGMNFMKCEEVNDDRLNMFDAFTILNRVFDIFLDTEERVDKMAEALHDSEESSMAMLSRTQGLLEKTYMAEKLQHEVYDIGKSPSETEIAQFQSAEEIGEKYVRTFTDRSLQTHEPIDLEDNREDSGTEEIISTPVATNKKPAAKKHPVRGK